MHGWVQAVYLWGARMKLDCPACYGTGTRGETGGPCPDCEGRGYTCWMRVSCPPYKKAEPRGADYGTESDGFEAGL